MENLLKHGEYESTIPSGSHGETFQEEIALALSLRMQANKSNFGLGYEVTKAWPFDDIVLLEKDKREAIHYIQVEHGHYSRKDGTVKSLGSKDFINASSRKKKGHYDLRKYLECYIDIQSNLQTNRWEQNFYMVTNRKLSEFFQEWLTIADKEGVNELLMFPKSSDSPKNPKQLIPTHNKEGEKTIDKLIKQLNPNIEKIKESLKKLFEEGTVDETLKDYSTPLKEVLEILEIDDKMQCSFKSSFLNNPSSAERLSSEIFMADRSSNKKKKEEKIDDREQSYACHLYNILRDENSENSILHKKTEIAENFLIKESENIRFPVYASEEIVEAFFQDLTLLVDQLDSLRETIHEKLQKWLRTWVQPDIFGKMSYHDMDQLYLGLTDTFKKWIESCNNDSRTLLNSDTIQGWLEELRKKNKKLGNEDETKLRELYVNRQIRHAVGQSISDTEFAEKFKTIFNDQELIAVVAGPGMGKTSLLKFLAFEIQKQNDSKVFLVYFYGLVEALNEIEEIKEFDGVLGVLEAVLSKENCKIIKDAAVQRDAKGCSIILFMDGFDEVPARHNQKVIQMLNQLKSIPSIQIIISSRERTQKLLKKKFRIQPLFLEPFTVENQISYLEKRWKISNDVHKKYMKNLLEKYHSSISCNLYISKLPLMMETLAEMHQKEFEASKIENSAVILNATELQRNFVKKCFMYKLVEKTGGSFRHGSFESVNDGDILLHQLLAIKLLDQELAKSVFKNKTFETKCKNFQLRCETDAETSLLVKVVKRKIRACDVLCSEYFVAKYLSENIVSLDAELVLRVLSKHKVVRNLTMSMFNSLKESISSDVRNMLLRTAAQHNFVNICGLLLNHKADPNDGDQEKQTALHFAALGGHDQVVRLLLNAGAFANSRTNAHETPLHMAAKNGHATVVKVLLRRGVNVDALDDNHATALQLATQAQHYQVIQLLIDTEATG